MYCNSPSLISTKQQIINATHIAHFSNTKPRYLWGFLKILRSKNVVQLLDMFETTNNYYLIQEFCDGGDFRGLLKFRKFLPENEALLVLKDLLSGFLELL